MTGERANPHVRSTRRRCTAAGCSRLVAFLNQGGGAAERFRTRGHADRTWMCVPAKKGIGSLVEHGTGKGVSPVLESADQLDWNWVWTWAARGGLDQGGVFSGFGRRWALRAARFETGVGAPFRAVGRRAGSVGARVAVSGSGAARGGSSKRARRAVTRRQSNHNRQGDVDCGWSGGGKQLILVFGLWKGTGETTTAESWVLVCVWVRQE